MAGSVKLSAEARRAAIITAVRRLFAEHGFHGTTTRALAEAAGVSEALLFKHFPNKEALYSAMLMSCAKGQDPCAQRLKALEPSASSLVVLVHFMYTRILAERPADDDEQAIQMRLMARSLMEDGEFARLHLQQLALNWLPKFEECLRAAIAAGEAHEGPMRSALAAWFMHHLVVAVLQYGRATPPVVDYGVAGTQLIEQLVWFALRGMGLKEETIRRHYNPQALAMFTA